MRLLDADVEELEHLGRTARELADHEFRWEQTTEKLLGAYRRTLAASW